MMIRIIITILFCLIDKISSGSNDYSKGNIKVILFLLLLLANLVIFIIGTMII